jgi:hypothetical protein
MRRAFWSDLLEPASGFARPFLLLEMESVDNGYPWARNNLTLPSLISKPFAMKLQGVGFQLKYAPL